MMHAARKQIAWISLAIFVASCALPLLNAHDLDLDCGASTQVSIISDLGGETLRSQADASTDFHCALCHWQRAVSGVQTGAAVSTAVVLSAAPAVSLCAESSLALISRCDGPLRAPPVFSS